MKIDKKSTTTYMTAKKRMGCNAPTEVSLLAFIQANFRFFGIRLEICFVLVALPHKCCIARPKILVKLVECKRINPL
jgi:hypothetical protein